MLELNSLDDVRGNNVIIYSLKTLLKNGTFPRFTILSGHMGVGKSSVARLVAGELNESFLPVQTYNFGMEVDMTALESDVFKMNPEKKRAFVFEELHGLDKAKQTALLTMLDKQPSNVYIIATTTELYKVLNTIRSRATRWDFKLLGARQLTQLLDDYLAQNGVTMTSRAKSLLVASAYGVPRDLLKNTDLAISGQFDAGQLEQLLGQVSEDLIFTVLCALKTPGTGFATSIQNLLEEVSSQTVKQFKDFYTRYLLERKGIEGSTLGSNRISTLDSLYSEEELLRIGKCLLRATPESLVLELTLLNLELTKVGGAALIGQQKDAVAQNISSAVAPSDTRMAQSKMASARVNPMTVGHLKFGE